MTPKNNTTEAEVKNLISESEGKLFEFVHEKLDPIYEGIKRIELALARERGKRESIRWIISSCGGLGAVGGFVFFIFTSI